MRALGVPLVAADADPRNGAASPGTVVQLDVLDAAALSRLLARVRPQVLVLAAGGVPSSPSFASDPAWEANVTGSAVAARAAVQAGIRRIVYVSSFAVYGAPDTSSIDEDAEVAPITEYGRMKVAAEQSLREEAAGVELKIARLCGIYGRVHDEARAGAWPRILTTALRHVKENGRLTLRESTFAGDEILYVKDAAAAIVALAVQDSVPGTVFNVGAGTITFAEDLAAALRLVFPSAEVLLEGGTGAGRSRPPLDVSRIERAYGFTPRYPLVEGLSDLADDLGLVGAGAR